MIDSAVLSFRRLRRAEKILDLHRTAGDRERAAQAHDAVLSDSALFELTHPSTRRGIMVKAKEAIVCLECEGVHGIAKSLRRFFRTRRSVDGQWLRDLRRYIERMEKAALNDYAIACLRSILAGMGRPRLAAVRNGAHTQGR